MVGEDRLKDVASYDEVVGGLCKNLVGFWSRRAEILTLYGIED